MLKESIVKRLISLLISRKAKFDVDDRLRVQIGDSRDAESNERWRMATGQSLAGGPDAGIMGDAETIDTQTSQLL